MLRSKPDVARRFTGRIDWNGLKVNKQEMMHSLSFRSNRWIDVVGFEMLRGDASFRLTYTITKGQGVLGNAIGRGSGFVPIGDILHPSRCIRMRSPIRVEPHTWYCVNVIIEIHEYEMYVTSSRGTNGRAIVHTDTGVEIEYANGLESCQKTNISSGQIAGIVFYCIDPSEEDFLRSRPLRLSSAEVETSHQKDVCIGSSLAALPDPMIDNADSQAENVIPPRALTVVASRDEIDRDKTSITLTSHTSNQSKYILPPVRGVLAPPVRTQEVLRQIPQTYK